MPELPEVETIRLQLAKEVVTKTIKEVIVRDKRIIKGISSERFSAQVKGKTIKDILRRGKVLIIKLGESLYLIIHLRISGWLELSDKEEKSSRIILKLSGGKFLNFCDQRVLGEARLIDDWHNLPIIKEMGPEPFEIKKSEFVKLFEGKRTKIKPLLMDQKFIAGIGNLYAQEALFAARINPEQGADKLDKAQLELLFDCLRSILKKAIKSRGSSVDSYRQLDGDQGSYASSLKVYQREKEPCVVCKTPLKRKAIAGRGTCFCPQCQK